MSKRRWTASNPDQQAVYDYYAEGGQLGYLYKHYKTGRMGIQKPARDHAYALAAWMAGHDNASLFPGEPS